MIEAASNTIESSVQTPKIVEKPGRNYIVPSVLQGVELNAKINRAVQEKLGGDVDKRK